MTWYENIPAVSYTFIDREGTRASHNLYYAMDSDRDSLWAAIRQETRFLPLTECGFCAREMRLGAALVGAPAATGLNMSCGVFVLRSMADTHTTLVIPGIKPELLLQTGCFAGIKIDMEHPAIVAFCSAITEIPLTTERGDLIEACTSGGGVNYWYELTGRSG